GIELAESLQFVELLLATPDHEPAEREAGAGGEGQTVKGEEPPASPRKRQGLALIEALVFIEVELAPGHEEIPAAWRKGPHQPEVGLPVASHIIHGAHGGVLVQRVLIDHAGKN